jgi:hypothetical protein
MSSRPPASSTPAQQPLAVDRLRLGFDPVDGWNEHDMASHSQDNIYHFSKPSRLLLSVRSLQLGVDAFFICSQSDGVQGADDVSRSPQRPVGVVEMCGDLSIRGTG